MMHKKYAQPQFVFKLQRKVKKKISIYSQG